MTDWVAPVWGRLKRVATSGNVLWVSEMPSDRWDLALELLDGGEGLCVLALPGRPVLGLDRWIGWPGADGHVHIAVFASQGPDQVPSELAVSEVAAGLALLQEVLDADPRLSQRLQRYGNVREYVFDYGQARCFSETSQRMAWFICDDRARARCGKLVRWYVRGLKLRQDRPHALR